MARLGHHQDVSPGRRVRMRKCGLDTQLKHDDDAHTRPYQPQKRCGISLHKTRFCKDRLKAFVGDPVA